MMAMGGPDIDVVIHEIGSTVGDIESLPFWRRHVRCGDVGAKTSSSCMSRWCPTSVPSGELKTKPTQPRSLRCVGRHPARCRRVPLRSRHPRVGETQDLFDV